MVEEKIAIIGGGSPYVPAILYSFANSGNVLAGSEISLMDIDPSRLPIMQKLGTRMVKEAGVNIKVTSTTNLKESLDGATFVLTNFRPGGLEGLRLDEEIPAKYGVLGQETTGPGGTFFALRSIPQVLDLCTAVEDICPDAWIENYVNPTNFVADAVRRQSKVKFIPICDGVHSLHFSLPKHLGCQIGEVRVRAAGVNHHTFLMELQVRNQDGYPLLRERWRERLKQAKGEEEKYLQLEIDFMDKYGIFPCLIHYLYPYLDHNATLADWRAGLHKRWLADLPTLWMNFERMAKGEIPIYMDPTKHHTEVGHGDMAVQIILAIVSNETREFHINVPNRRSITNLPQGSIVEVPCLVDARGVRPICMSDLPKGVVGLSQSLITWQELTVDAALTGDRSLVVQALLAHPWRLSLTDAEKICDEMLRAHARYLPQFK